MSNAVLWQHESQVVVCVLSAVQRAARHPAVSFRQVSAMKPHIQLSSPHLRANTLFISLFVIWSPEYYAFGGVYRSIAYSLCHFFQHPVTSSLQRPNIFFHISIRSGQNAERIDGNVDDTL